MPLSNFTAETAQTTLGPLKLLLSPDPSPETRPLVFVLPSVLSSTDNFGALQQRLGFLADMVIALLPIQAAPSGPAPAVPDLVAAIGALLETRFADRNIVLVGASSGAALALGVRARNLARIVAIDPPLVTGDLWPVIGPLQQFLRGGPGGVAAAFALATFGVGETEVAPRDHRALLLGLDVPTEVILGAEPLEPKREVARFPSLVGAAERRLLAATPGVRLHIVPETGHNVLGQAMQAASEIVLEACRRAGERLPPARLRVDEPLLEATPLTAGQVLHAGPDGAAFAEAYRRMNPRAEVTVLGGAAPPPDHDERFDAVVFSRPPSSEQLARHTPGLKLGGHVIARWAAPTATLHAKLAAHGLALREPIDASGTGVIRAQKLPPGAAPDPALTLDTVAFARILMDVRTRLPARQLRSDPELQIVYDVPPFVMPARPREAPKVLVLQRTAELSGVFWRPLLANWIRDGWLVVSEYDDYPPLINEVKGLPRAEGDLERFGYAHAVQTASPPLVELFRPYNPETVLFPNAVFDLAPYPQAPRPRRVFYGGVLRGRYPVEVARALAPAIARHPDVEFVVLGDRDVFDALPAAAKRYYDYMSYEAYLGLMSQCAISLSPIEALPHRDTKSDAKYLDASRSGVLTIASPTIYDRVIRHGVNGFLAPQISDWSPLLDQALSDEPLRDRMARNAWEHVRDERMFADQIVDRRAWYLDLWARREALTEALIARVPGLREDLSA